MKHSSQRAGYTRLLNALEHTIDMVASSGFAYVPAPAIRSLAAMAEGLHAQTALYLASATKNVPTAAPRAMRKRLVKSV